MGVVTNEGCSSPCLISSGTAERVRGRVEGSPPGSWRGSEGREGGGKREEGSEGGGGKGKREEGGSEAVGRGMREREGGSGKPTTF